MPPLALINDVFYNNSIWDVPSSLPLIFFRPYLSVQWPALRRLLPTDNWQIEFEWRKYGSDLYNIVGRLEFLR